MRRAKRSTHPIGNALERFSERTTELAGTSGAFILAIVTVIAWAASGPIFGYSDTWQLVINTGTTLVTFLMVFLIQRSQNKATTAMELKLNEIVAALEGASNRLIDVESLSEEELHTLHRYYQKLSEMSKKDSDVRTSHSVEEAAERQEEKRQHRHARKHRTKK